MKRIAWIAIAAAGLTLAACDEPNSGEGSGGGNAQRPLHAPQPEMAMMAADTALRSAKTAPGLQQRMERGRNYAIEIINGNVEEAMQADRAACLKLKCVITAVNTSKLGARPTALLRALVPLDNADAFHEQLTNAPDRVIASFNETAQNRQEQYQDIKARLERLEFMKKRLYALADQKSDKVGDLLQVERELMRVEGEIERLTRDRKGLEKVTDNVTFTLNYSQRPPKAGDVDFSPFSGLLSDMANTLIDAVRTTLVWVARWTPAAVLVLGVGLVLRRRKRGHAAQDKPEDG